MRARAESFDSGPTTTGTTGTIPGQLEEMMMETLRSNPPTLMNEREVAVFLGVCPRSIRNFTARGLLPVIRLGRRRLFRRDAVLAAIVKLETPGGR